MLFKKQHGDEGWDASGCSLSASGELSQTIKMLLLTTKIWENNTIILHKNCGQSLSTLYNRIFFLFKDKFSLCSSSWPWSQKFFCPCFPRDRITAACQCAWRADSLGFIARYYPQAATRHSPNWAHQTCPMKTGMYCNWKAYVGFQWMGNKDYKTPNPPYLFFILKMGTRTLSIYYGLVELKLLQISLKGKQK